MGFQGGAHAIGWDPKKCVTVELQRKFSQFWKPQKWEGLDFCSFDDFSGAVLFQVNQPGKFQESREIAQENFVGGKWKALFCVGCVVSEQRRKKMSSWKIQKKCKNTTFLGGLSTTATEILFSSCWGAIWLVFERWAKELQGDRELWLQALWEWCQGLLRSFRMDDWWWSLN